MQARKPFLFISRIGTLEKARLAGSPATDPAQAPAPVATDRIDLFDVRVYENCALRMSGTIGHVTDGGISSVKCAADNAVGDVKTAGQ